MASRKGELETACEKLWVRVQHGTNQTWPLKPGPHVRGATEALLKAGSSLQEDSKARGFLTNTLYHVRRPT